MEHEMSTDDAGAPAGEATHHPGVRVVDTEVLSGGWSELRRSTVALRRDDGSWARLTRETYDRGNGACILLYDPEAGTVLLVRQFRFPAFVNGHPDGMLLEVPAGLLDGDHPEDAIRREAEEETGIRVGAVAPLFELFMSPGSVTERVAFFAAPVRAADRVSAGGGLHDEEEEVEVVELRLDDALEMVARGEIIDGKTVLLLLWAQRELVG
jgi:nudix-type nucleoside diphosphatase (YffH/AdpP family)